MYNYVDGLCAIFILYYLPEESRMKLFQNLVSQIREIISCDFGFADDTGLILASSTDGEAGQIDPNAARLMQSKEQQMTLDGITYQKVSIKGKMEFVAFIKSDNPADIRLLPLIALNISNVKEYHDEKFDKGSFIKNIILDNVLPGDIPHRAKEFHLNNSSFRAVFLIKTEAAKDIYAYDIVQSLFPNKAKDFIVTIDDENTVLVKDLKSGEDYKEIEKTARNLIDTLSTEIMTKVSIGIGTIVENLKDIGRSYKEAQIALLVGGIFESDKDVINYNKLGIGRLIYQLPTTLCRLFLKEVFKEGSFESLDQETILTIQKFFENNLNVSETSRQLYVHRNTLVYRLDKIEKITGLDLRKFDDAIIFKVAMFVKKYLDRGERIM